MSHKDKLHTVAVYGTLKRGQGKDSILKGAKYLGNATSIAPYGLYDTYSDAYPVLLESVIEGKIVDFEVIEVDDKILSKMDKYEGHPTFFQRKSIKVHTQFGDTPTIQVWCYFFVGDTLAEDELSKPLSNWRG